MKVDGLMPEIMQTMPGPDGAKKGDGNAFSSALSDAMGETANAIKHAEQLTLAAANGEEVAMHDVIQAVSKAELTLQSMLTVRDRAAEAYQEVLRMPI